MILWGIATRHWICKQAETYQTARRSNSQVSSTSGFFDGGDQILAGVEIRMVCVKTDSTASEYKAWPIQVVNSLSARRELIELGRHWARAIVVFENIVDEYLLSFGSHFCLEYMVIDREGWP